MRSVKKNKNGYFKYNTLVNFMLKNKNNKLYYRGKGITSNRNLYNYWNYAHSHKTAFIPRFHKMYDIIHIQVKRASVKKSCRQVINKKSCRQVINKKSCRQVINKKSCRQVININIVLN